MKTLDETENNTDMAKEVRSNSFGWTIKTLSTKLDNQLLSGLKPLKLSLHQFAILMTLLEQDGMHQAEIGRKIAMPRYATTRNLDKLENYGYIQRKRHEISNRSHHIYLTSKGKSIGPDLFSLVNKTNNEILAALSDKEKKRIVALLKKLLE